MDALNVQGEFLPPPNVLRGLLTGAVMNSLFHKS